MGAGHLVIAGAASLQLAHNSCTMLSNRVRQPIQHHSFGLNLALQSSHSSYTEAVLKCCLRNVHIGLFQPPST